MNPPDVRQKVPGIRAGRRLLLVGILAVAVAGGFFVIDRGTVERGNFLYRAGDAEGAVEVYRSRLDAPPETRDLVRHNLGTALLAIDPEEGVEQLEEASASSAPEISASSLYSLGAMEIAAGARLADADSLADRLAEAVRLNREALRRQPGHPDATWNLSIAQRMLDSLSMFGHIPDHEVGAGDDDTLIDLTAMVRSETGEGASGEEPETPNPAVVTSERTGADRGAQESWTSFDPGPVSDSEALAYLDVVRDEPERLIRGLLWSLRPPVEWWTGQQYPGGDW